MKPNKADKLARAIMCYLSFGIEGKRTKLKSMHAMAEFLGEKQKLVSYVLHSLDKEGKIAADWGTNSIVVLEPLLDKESGIAYLEAIKCKPLQDFSSVAEEIQ